MASAAPIANSRLSLEEDGINPIFTLSEKASSSSSSTVPRYRIVQASSRGVIIKEQTSNTSLREKFTKMLHSNNSPTSATLNPPMLPISPPPSPPVQETVQADYFQGDPVPSCSSRSNRPKLTIQASTPATTLSASPASAPLPDEDEGQGCQLKEHNFVTSPPKSPSMGSFLSTAYSPGDRIKRSATTLSTSSKSRSPDKDRGRRVSRPFVSPISTSSLSPGPFIGRAMSYGPSHSVEYKQSHSDSTSSNPNNEPPIIADADFEQTIAQQAEEIRRERQNKKAEKEKLANKQVQKRERSLSKSGDEVVSSVDPYAHANVGNQPLSPVQVTETSRAAPRIERRFTVLEEKPLVGNLIGEGHVNFVLMYNMLTGIRIGVSRCQAKMERPLTDEDYTAQHKFSFDIVGNELTPSARYDFKFKDYAPWVFRALREHFLLDPADYLLSLTAKYILSELGSPGKSGSFFYFSRDYRFIIKTIHHAEHKFLRRILKRYHEHVKSNPHTLISRFYGLHRVKLPRGRKIHFVIMNNLMPPHRDIHETYDLKGSTVSREYPEDKAALNPGATLKDLNWLNRKKRMHLGPEKRLLFLEQLRADAAFLQDLKVMDYSLLIAIHDLERGNKDKIREGALTMFSPESNKNRRRLTQVKRDRDQDPHSIRKAVERSDPKAIDPSNRLPDKDHSERRHFIFYQDEGGLRATDNWDEPIDTIYYMGIIDILTPFGFKKCLENFFKGMVEDKHAISPVPPVEYATRFTKFIALCVTGKSKEEMEKSPTEKYQPPPGKEKAE